jgi:hypothetical protein
MTSTIRTQQRYDHRLRDLVRSSGNINLATQLGVPRSTAHSWLTSSQVEIVTVDVFDMDILSLQKEVLALRRRLTWIVALFRLVVVSMKVSGFSLDNAQLHLILDRFSIVTSRSLGFARDRLRTATPVVSLNRARPNMGHTWTPNCPTYFLPIPYSGFSDQAAASKICHCVCARHP